MVFRQPSRPISTSSELLYSLRVCLCRSVWWMGVQKPPLDPDVHKQYDPNYRVATESQWWSSISCTVSYSAWLEESASCGSVPKHLVLLQAFVPNSVTIEPRTLGSLTAMWQWIFIIRAHGSGQLLCPQPSIYHCWLASRVANIRWMLRID